MKRIVALSLVFAVMGTAAVSAFAQTDNGQSAAVSVTVDTDVVSYLEYIEKYEETAGQDITLLGTVATVERGGELLLPVTVPVSSWYNLEITYRATENDTGEISFSVLLDGKLPFAEADRFSLPRRYIDGGEIRMLGKARGSKQGNNLLRQMVEKSGGINFAKPFCLAYSGLSDVLLQKYIADSAELWQTYTKHLPVTTVGCAIGTHVGPGAVAVAFYTPENGGALA